MTDEAAGPLDAYRDEFPVLDPLAFECLGRHGYGNGRVLAGNVTGPALTPKVPTPSGPGREIVGGCQACEKSQECWELTRDKARELFPVLMELVDEITAEGRPADGRNFLDIWKERTDQPAGPGTVTLPPDMLLTIENMHHGSAHSGGARWAGPKGGIVFPEEGS